MGKASKKKVHKRTFKATMPVSDTVAILAGWIRLDHIPEHQICGNCKKNEAVARMEHYENRPPEVIMQRRATATSDEQLGKELFEETYQEQQTHGPVHYGTSWFCQDCFIAQMFQVWIGPASSPTILEQFDRYGDRAGVALYRRRTRPLRFAGLTTFETDVQEVWKQRAMVETYQGVPGQRIVLVQPDK